LDACVCELYCFAPVCTPFTDKTRTRTPFHCQHDNRHNLDCYDRPSGGPATLVPEELPCIEY
jgi:hypothetical protein